MDVVVVVGADGSSPGPQVGNAVSSQSDLEGVVAVGIRGLVRRAHLTFGPISHNRYVTGASPVCVEVRYRRDDAVDELECVNQDRRNWCKPIGPIGDRNVNSRCTTDPVGARLHDQPRRAGIGVGERIGHERGHRRTGHVDVRLVGGLALHVRHPKVPETRDRRLGFP